MALAVHRMGVSSVEAEICKKWTCIGLRRILLEVCEGSCSRCRLIASGNQWFAKTVSEFSPPTEAIARPLSANFGIKFCELPPVCGTGRKFRQPAMLEAVDPDGNCVFRLLARAIGGTGDDHKKLRGAVLAHTDDHDVMAGLRNIYGQTELDRCRSHRETEKEG